MTNMARSRKLPPGVQMKDICSEVAKSCAAQVKGLPKGERLRAYRQCIKERKRKRFERFDFEAF